MKSRLCQVKNWAELARAAKYRTKELAGKCGMSTRALERFFVYDSLGQVVAGNKYWADGTPVAGQQFDYTFDTIGNRTATLAGGDQNGSNLRSASYSANNLNQYTSRDIPGALDVMGVGFATNTVTVNGQTAYRKGEYFRQQLSVSNTTAPVWLTVTISATNQTTLTGNIFVPKTQEHFYYDADGNLARGGVIDYGFLLLVHGSLLSDAFCSLPSTWVR